MRTDYRIGHTAIIGKIGHLHFCEQSDGVGTQSRRIDNSSMLQHPLLETYPAKQPRLFALGGMVLEVLA